MTKFDPTHHEFVQLQGFHFPGDVSVFEFRNHCAADGTHDFLRLNIYLSKDEDFVCNWHGFLDEAIAESMLPATAPPPGVDFGGAYNTELFRGYLPSDETATVVLTALRVDNSGYSAQVLRVDAIDGLICDALKGAPRHGNA